VRHRIVRAVLAAAASAALLSACAVDRGAVAESSEQVPSIQGVGGAAGQVTVDDALVVFPPRLQYAAGSDAPLSLVLTNRAATDDELVSASSAAARAVEVTPAMPGTTPPALGCVRAPNPPEPLASVPPPTAPVAQPVPNGGSVAMTPNCPHLLLVGLLGDLTVAGSVPLRLTFANAGTVDLLLPVHTSNHALPRQVIPGVDAEVTPTPAAGE
jgi:copper(I)-binding protein